MEHKYLLADVDLMCEQDLQKKLERSAKTGKHSARQTRRTPEPRRTSTSGIRS